MLKSKRIIASVMILAMVLGLALPGFAAALPDVSGTTYEEAAKALHGYGVLTGYEDGTFKPNNNITRAEFATVIIRALGLEDEAQLLKGTTKFADVNADATNAWATGYINLAEQMGIVQGYPGGTFNAKGNVTNAEALTMQLRALGYDLSGTGAFWFLPVLVKAQELGVGTTETPNSAAIRGKVAQYVFNGLDVVIVGKGQSMRSILDPNAQPPVEGFQVVKAEALNLNQIKVTFSQAVNEETAGDLNNYILDNGEGVAARLDAGVWAGVPAITLVKNAAGDVYEVIITLSTTGDAPRLANQKEAELSVEKVNNKNLTGSIPKYTTKFTLVDTQPPSASSVEVFGNRVLKVKFSEEVKNATIASNYRINGNSLFTYGLDGNISYDSKTLTATITFINALPNGQFTLQVSHNDTIVDLVGLRLMKQDVPFSITTDTTSGQLKEIVVDKDKNYIDLVFTKPLASIADKGTGTNIITISSPGVNSVDAFATLSGKMSVVDGKLRITTAGTSLTAEGVHAINLTNDGSRWLKDAYGINYATSSTTYYIAPDKVKPEVTKVEQSKAKEIEVTFSKAVQQASAENKFNYTLKNSSGTIQNIDTAVIKSGSNSRVVTLTLVNTPDSGNYTLTVAGVRDNSNNLMDSYNTTVAIGDKTGPTVSTVAFANRDVYVTFSKNVDSASATNLANYRYKNAAIPAGTTVTMLTGAQVRLRFPVATTLTTTDDFAVSGEIQDVFVNKMETFGWSGKLAVRQDDVAIAAWGSRDVRAISKNVVEFRLNKELNSIAIADFQLSVDGGATWVEFAGSNAAIPSFVNVDGQARVKFTFTNAEFLGHDAKIGANAVQIKVKAAAPYASEATDGTKFAASSAAKTVNDYIAPELAVAANRVRTVTKNGTNLTHIVVEFTEAMNAADFSTGSFQVAGYNVVSVKAVNQADFATLIAADIDTLVAANGKFVVIKLETKSVDDRAATPAVTFQGTMRDASANNNTFNLPSSAIVATKGF